MTRVSIAIQTHPRRVDLATALLSCLDGNADVVPDPKPDATIASPWRTYRHALEQTPAWATHRLVIQDDVLICDGFRAAITSACAARPGRVIAFFVAGNPVQHRMAVLRARDKGHTWAELDGRLWVPAVATCWPVQMIQPFLNWFDGMDYPEQFTADDEIIGRYLRSRGETAIATVPSLVEHPDTVPSIAGRRRAQGDDPGRVAALWIGDCGPCDATLINWST